MTWHLEIVRQPWGLVERGILTLREAPGFPLVEIRPGQTLTVGRSQDCEVHVPSLTVNRRHAQLRRDESGLWLTDLGSSAGTYLMTHAIPRVGQIAGPSRLDVDDAIWFANFGLVLTPRFAVPATWRAWGGGAIWRLAQAAQQGRDWSTLPVLADALEEAGGGEEDLLLHFRTVSHRLRHCAALLRLLEGLLSLRGPGRSA